MPGQPTIYDVARLARVAPSTVSRAFSRPGRVSTPTAERVRAAAAELGYRPTPVAPVRPPARTGMVALSVSDIANPVYVPVIRGAERAAARTGASLVLGDTQESERRERDWLDRTLGMVDGVVLAGSRMSDGAVRRVARSRPVVVLNRTVQGVPSVVAEPDAGVGAAVRHLLGLGHLDVAYLGGPADSWADGARWRALLEATQAAGGRTRRLGPYPPTVAGGADALPDVLADRSGAVMVYNDQMAIGLMRAAAGRGIAVPEEFSVVGFDDIEAARLVRPGLTTVAAPLEEMGATAVDAVLGLASGALGATERMGLPTWLVLRESTAHPSR